MTTHETTGAIVNVNDAVSFLAAQWERPWMLLPFPDESKRSVSTDVVRKLVADLGLERAHFACGVVGLLASIADVEENLPRVAGMLQRQTLLLVASFARMAELDAKDIEDELQRVFSAYIADRL